jgi:hypothetical protein
MDSPPPVASDKDGHYPLPQPGILKKGIRGKRDSLGESICRQNRAKILRVRRCSAVGA